MLGTVTTWVRADEATRLLGVSKPTLYAYVSRGMIERHAAVDGRTSLYARADVERLAGRARSRAPAERPTIDTQVASGVSELHDSGLLYRGRPAAELARAASFEQVAELLWTGTLPDAAPAWRPDRAAHRRLAATLSAADNTDPVGGRMPPTDRLSLTATLLAGTRAAHDDDPATAARRLLALAPSALGGPLEGTLASRLTRAYVRRPGAELVAAIDRALALLADHELATSTLAVRLAVSVRTDPYSALAVGLHTVSGAMHGGAAAHVVALLADAHTRGAPAAVAEPVGRAHRLSGFGHSIYRNADPRVAPLMEAVAPLADRAQAATIDAVAAEAVATLGRHPNIDFALGALLFAAGLPADVPVFAVARIAGWGAHAAEETAERPLRYRGLARPAGAT